MQPDINVPSDRIFALYKERIAALMHENIMLTALVQKLLEDAKAKEESLPE